MTTTPTKFWFIARAIGAMIALCGVGIAATGAEANAADGWGSIKGRFLYDGAAPAPVKVNAGGQAFCGQIPLVNEDLVVAKDGGIANVVVWVRSKVKINPKFAAAAANNVPLDNRNCHFEPHVVGLVVGQTLVIKNSDPIAHNTKIDGQNTQVNPLIPAGAVNAVPIAALENVPAPVNCSIHGWMHAWMVVRPNPYFAISDKDGNFEIKDVPAGEWEFQLWHERSGYVTDATISGKNVKWLKGRVKWTVEGDKAADLGEMKLAAAQFNK